MGNSYIEKDDSILSFDLSVLNDEERVNVLMEYQKKLMAAAEIEDQKNVADLEKVADLMHKQYQKAAMDDKWKLLNQLYSQRQFTGWMIGDFCAQIGNEIWDNEAFRNKYKDLKGYYTVHSEVLPFSLSEMYEFIRIRQKFTKAEYIALRPTRAKFISLIKDDEDRNDLKEVAIRQDLTVQQIKDMIAAKREQEQEETRIIRQEEKAAMARVTFSLITEGSQVIITAKTKKHARAIQEYIDAHYDAICREIIRER